MAAILEREVLTPKEERQFIKAVARYRLLPGKYIVRKLQLPETTKGGIILPPIVRKKAVGNLHWIAGKVLAAPTKGRDGGESPIRTGDTIIYNSYNIGKLSVWVDGEMVELPVVREIDIDAVVREEATGE